MGYERVLTQDFRQEGRDNDYPFVDGTSLVSNTRQTITTGLFLDACLYPAGTFNDLQIQEILIDDRNCVLSIGDSEGDVVATTEFDPLAAVDLLSLTDSSGRPAGVLVVDPTELATLQTWPQGTHLFRLNTARFVAPCIIPTPETGVRSIQVDDELVSGDAILIGEEGVVLREVETGVIRVDVIGDPLFARRLCRPFDLFQTPRFLQTINGISADQYGNFNFTVIDNTTGDTILRVIPEGKDTLVLSAVGQRLAGA